jgi:hypothetical protein
VTLIHILVHILREVPLFESRLSEVDLISGSPFENLVRLPLPSVHHVCVDVDVDVGVGVGCQGLPSVCPNASDAFQHLSTTTIQQQNPTTSCSSSTQIKTSQIHWMTSIES